MKRLGLLLGLVLIAISRPAYAADWSLDNFDTTITIARDTSIEVTETLKVNFLGEHHGIFRYIPFRYDVGQSKKAAIPITVQSITQDGADVPFTESKQGDNIVETIGDANMTILGPHTYVLLYRAEAAVNFFSDHDELYWNVTGNDWPVPVTNVTAKVVPPTGATLNQLQTTCYTGEVGSREKNCTIAQAATQSLPGIVFSAHDPLTVVVGWPKGLVTKPANYDALRAKANQDFGWGWQHPLTWIVNTILSLAGIVGLWMFWSRRGRDPKTRGPIIPQYDPPSDVRPAELSAIMKQSVRPDVVSATIVDLAVRGHLHISELEEEHLLGLRHTKDYQFTRTDPKKAGPALKAYEKLVLTALFGNEVAKGETKLSDLRKTFPPMYKGISKSIFQQITDDGYFTENPNKIRTTMFVMGGVLLALTQVSIPFGIWFNIVLGIAFFVAATVIPKYTPKGRLTEWEGRGFKLFLNTAEKYRLQWQERENIFSLFLPYAMVLGVAEHWSHALADVTRQAPEWYTGTPGSEFNSLILWSSLHSMTTSTVTTAAAGGSGFGGGGFSGGGGGGGGGGAW